MAREAAVAEDNARVRRTCVGDITRRIPSAEGAEPDKRVTPTGIICPTDVPAIDTHADDAIGLLTALRLSGAPVTDSMEPTASITVNTRVEIFFIRNG